jgi:hypothetical protein
MDTTKDGKKNYGRWLLEVSAWLRIAVMAWLNNPS